MKTWSEKYLNSVLKKFSTKLKSTKICHSWMNTIPENISRIYTISTGLIGTQSVPFISNLCEWIPYQKNIYGLCNQPKHDFPLWHILTESHKF